MIKLVTDSTCDLPQSWLKRYNITVVPVNIQFGLETFYEDVTITPQAFYQRIDTGENFPTTSQPSIGKFCEIYQKLTADGSEVLSIHLAGKLSGTWQAATIAARQINAQTEASAKVTVIDSFTGSVGLGFMMREVAQLVKAGHSVDEIVSHLTMRRMQVNVFILLKDLRYARLSGRVGRVRQSFASLLNVKPILGVNQGSLVLLERVRGYKKGMARMLTLAEQAAGNAPVHVAVAHAVDQPQAEKLMAQIKTRLNVQDTFITDVAISLAVHFGPGTVGFVTYPAD